MKILSKLDNTGMIDEVTDKRYVTDAEKSAWNSKSDTDTITTINGKTGAITKADIVALGIPSQDTDTTYSEITTAEIDEGTASTPRTITARRIRYFLEIVQYWIGELTKSDVGLSNVDNVKQATKVEFDAHKEDLEKHITNSERDNWNSKGAEDLGIFNNRTELIDHVILNQLPTGQYYFLMDGSPHLMLLGEGEHHYVVMFQDNAGLQTLIAFSKTGEILEEHTLSLLLKIVDLEESIATLSKSDVGLSNVDNVKQMPISGGVLENYREKLTTVSASGGSIDLSLGNVFVHTPSGNRTYTIANAVGGQAHSFTLIVNMGSTVRTLTFPASVKWQGGEIPDLTTASKTYILTFMTVDGGTNWLGMFGGEF